MTIYSAALYDNDEIDYTAGKAASYRQLAADAMTTASTFTRLADLYELAHAEEQSDTGRVQYVQQGETARPMPRLISQIFAAACL